MIGFVGIALDAAQVILLVVLVQLFVSVRRELFDVATVVEKAEPAEPDDEPPPDSNRVYLGATDSAEPSVPPSPPPVGSARARAKRRPL